MPQFVYTKLYLAASLIWLFLLLSVSSPTLHIYTQSYHEITQSAIWIGSIAITLLVVWSFTKRPGHRDRQGWHTYFPSLVLALLISVPWVYDFLIVPESVIYEPIRSHLVLLPIAVLLLSTWRMLGLPLALIAGVFSIYFVWGHLLPDAWSHKETDPWWSLMNEGYFVRLKAAVVFILPTILLGAFIDSLGKTNVILGRWYQKLHAGQAPKIFVRHFWTWVLVGFTALRLISHESNLSFSEDLPHSIAQTLAGRLNLLILWLVPCLLFWAWYRNAKAPEQPAALRATGRGITYLILMLTKVSFFLPYGMTLAAWAWRDRRQSDESPAPAPIRYVFSALLVSSAILLLMIFTDLTEAILKSEIRSAWKLILLVLPLLIALGAIALRLPRLRAYWGVLSVIAAYLVIMITRFGFGESIGSGVEMALGGSFLLMLLQPGAMRIRSRRSLTRLLKSVVLRFPQMASLVVLTVCCSELIINVVAQTDFGALVQRLF